MNTEKSTIDTTGYRRVLKDDESLGVFLRAMKDFEEEFLKAMLGGSEFTLNLEIHGAKSNLINCRVKSDRHQRPRGSQVKQLN